MGEPGFNRGNKANAFFAAQRCVVASVILRRYPRQNLHHDVKSRRAAGFEPKVSCGEPAVQFGHREPPHGLWRPEQKCLTGILNGESFPSEDHGWIEPFRPVVGQEGQT